MKIVTTLLAGLLSLLLFGCGDSGYEKRNGVWYYDGMALHRITQPDQFKPLLGPFAKGADAGYYRGGSLDKASVFYSSNDPDANPVPHNTIRLTGASPASFNVKDAGYAADANEVYYQGKVLTKNVVSFQVQQYGYARSGNVVYFEGKPITGADAATFATLERRDEQADARDAHASYLEGKRVPVASAKAAGT